MKKKKPRKRLGHASDVSYYHWKKIKKGIEEIEGESKARRLLLILLFTVVCFVFTYLFGIK